MTKAAPSRDQLQRRILGILKEELTRAWEFSHLDNATRDLMAREGAAAAIRALDEPHEDKT